MTDVAIPADAYYELSVQEVRDWCKKAAKLGYLEETQAKGHLLYFVTDKGSAYLDSCYRKTVHTFLSSYDQPYTEEQFMQVLKDFVSYKSQTVNPVLCLVQCMHEEHQYKQSLN